MKRYALRHKETGRLLVWSTRNNGDDADGNSTSIDLHIRYNDLEKEHIWYAISKAQAAFVKKVSTEWYNSDMQTPTHSFDEEELEVVSVEIEVKIELEDCNAPSYIEVMRSKYGGSTNRNDIEHLAHLESRFADRDDYSYSFYDLQEAMKSDNNLIKEIK